MYDAIYDALDVELGGTFSEEIMETYFAEFPFGKSTATEAMIELADRAKKLVLNGEITLSELLQESKSEYIETLVEQRKRGR